MNAIITYASWFGHNRAIAEMLTQEFATLGISVACVPAYRVKPRDVEGRDLLVLGTYTHGGHASKKLRRLCDSIPQKQLERMAVAVFGTHVPEGTDSDVPDGISDLVTHLSERGCELVLPPLRISLSREAALHRSGSLDESVQRQVWEFAGDLHDACVATPLI